MTQQPNWILKKLDMPEKQHTLFPLWTIETRNARFPICVIQTEKGTIKSVKEKAEFILKAVNCHEELRGLLVRIKEELDFKRPRLKMIQQEIEQAMATMEDK